MAPMVLVVDDEATVAVLADVLEDEGYEVHTAWDGRSASGMIEQQRPDLVLLDIHLSLLNGFDMLRELRASAQVATVPIIAMTADSEASQAVQSPGVEICIAKPFHIEKVLSYCATFLTSIQ